MRNRFARSLANVDLHRCEFCSGAAAFGPFDGASVCEGCARRIAELVLRSDARTLGAIWSSARQLADPPAGIVPTAEEAVADAALTDFTRGVANVISPAHVPLRAQLPVVNPDDDFADSLRRAVHAAADDDGVAVALRVLLTPPLLRPGGILELRRRLLAD
jgi:hypothetical protein